MTLDERDPIVMADTGPLIRLAAAGLLDGLRATDRRAVIVDRLEAEATWDQSKPYAREIADWISRNADAIERPRTVIGAGIEQLESEASTPEQQRLLKGALRNSGEKAMREFVEDGMRGTPGALVVYEDAKVATLFLDADFTVTLMTTRAFAETIAEWGVNADAVAALESIAPRYNLKPALVATYEVDTPPDMRQLPQPRKQ